MFLPDKTIQRITYALAGLESVPPASTISPGVSGLSEGQSGSGFFYCRYCGPLQ